jgi:tetratricopeptide (TPR) repeat protein
VRRFLLLLGIITPPIIFYPCEPREVAMRFNKTLTFLILAMAVAFVLRAVALRQKPFTQEQVSNMVQAGLGDDSGVKLIEQRGIDFAPSDDLLQTLKAAGASEAFISALRTAKPPEPASAKKPINQVQVFALLVGQVPSHRVTRLVQERGIDFEPTDDYLQEVRLAGGEDELISALKSAKVTKPEHIDPALQARQTEIRQRVARGAEFFQGKRYADAEAEFREAVRLDPENADLHVNLGATLGNEGDWDGEIAEEREALRVDPNNESAHVDLGAALGAQRDWNDEIAQEREALRLNPNNDMAHNNLGAALGGKGDWDGEIAHEREALRLNPNNEFAHVNLGRALGAKGDWDGAIAQEREALRLNPNNANAHDFIGAALGNKGDWDGDIAEHREALSLDPNNELAHVNLGVALGVKGDWDGEIAQEHEALRLNSKNESAHVALGLALRAKGDCDGEITEEREALRLNPSNGLAHAALGDALEKKGDQPGALEEYRATYMLDPKNATNKQNYERLLQPTPPLGPAARTEKHPGVWVSGYGYPAGSFQSVYMGLVDFLSSSGVEIANSAPEKFTSLRESGFTPLSAVLETASKAGADSLLYLKTERNELQGVTTIHMQCFDSAGKLLWEEKATSPWADGSPGVIRLGWKKKLAPHVGKPGLILKQAQ